MALTLQFDANQQFQIDAVDAVVDLFEGQPQGPSPLSIVTTGGSGTLFEGLEQTELGAANRLLLVDETLRANTRRVQVRNDIDVNDEGAALDSWDVFDGPANLARTCPHFSVEMETGTGKTYVYLRTVFELAKRYGFQKFIIVVPSIAVREGVLKSIQVTADHFRGLYDGLPFEHFVYDGARPNRLRQFATSTTVQLMVINIDAFRRDFGEDDERAGNVIYKESDGLSGHAPIEFVQAARPIVIIDEPQSVDSTPKAQDAIKKLNPLCTLRYSATHRDVHNLVYRLDPIRAFELNLVKQIVVASAEAQGGANEPFVRLEEVDNKAGIRARLRIYERTDGGPRERSVPVRQGADLYELSDQLAMYAQGFEVAEMNAEPGNEYVRFSSGRTLRRGEQIGGMRDDLWRMQIRHTLRRHLDHELRLQERSIKVLSLFFIDRVANYRDDDRPGKFAVALEEEIQAARVDANYAGLTWLQLPSDQLHNGYFARDRKGTLKDSRTGESQDDEGAYELIMKDKERLLSPETPLRFIFSHSALREGWDNPNVFQICTLNESRSVIKKRQEIGRGLRLPVDATGARVFDPSINQLYVMANESYEEFARALQTEYEDDCNVVFGRVPITAFIRLERVVDGELREIGRPAALQIQAALISQKMLDADGRIQPAFTPARPGFGLTMPAGFEELELPVIDLLSRYQIERHVRREREQGPNRLNKQVQLSEDFRELWERIKARTTYRVEFETDELVQRCVDGLRRMERIKPPVVVVSAGRVEISRGGVKGRELSSVQERPAAYQSRPVPDILGYLQNETELTRGTIFRILKQSGRLEEFFNDPQRFMDAVAGVIKYELHRLLVDGIKYERIPSGLPDAEWEMRRFEDGDGDLINYLTAQRVKNSIYEYVPYQSQVERRFAEALDSRTDVRLFVKLPAWFKVDTPVGAYNPDWAVVKHKDETIYMIRETKATKDYRKLRTSENDKVRCGEKHFEALGVSFDVAIRPEEV